MVQTDWDNEEAVTYLQHRFGRMGFDDLLAKAGVKGGDEVRVLDFAFEYEGAPEEDEEMASEDEAEALCFEVDDSEQEA